MNENRNEMEPTAQLSLGARIDLVCSRFESAYRAGERPRIEDLLAGWHELDQPVLLRELLLLDIHYRKQSENPPSYDEYAQRFPDQLDVVADALQDARGVTDRTNNSPSALTVGSTLGEYEVVEQIGAGGMGEVYKCRHRRMRRLVAVKTLHSTLLDSSAAIRRFQREVEAAAQLEHPNIVTAYDAGEKNGIHFLVMQFVEGEDLRTRLVRNGPLSPAAAVDCIRQAATGLSFAHTRGVVHRDIKPSNLLIDHAGMVKVLDLGLARVDLFADKSGNAVSELTEHGTLLGTIDYMSPEQAMDPKGADGRADIYSLGCTLFFLLTGRSVYGGTTIAEKIVAHREHPIPSLCDLVKGIPQELELLFHQMVAKQPEDRLQTMEDVIRSLESCRSALPDTLRAPSDAEEEISEAPTASTKHEKTHRGSTRPTSLPKTEVSSFRGFWPIAVGAILLFVSLASVTLAYHSRWSTVAWNQRFDTLQGSYVEGLGWEIECLRSLIFVPTIIVICSWKFRWEAKRLVDPRLHSWRLNLTRILFILASGYFGFSEATRHLSLEQAPRELAVWELKHNRNPEEIGEKRIEPSLEEVQKQSYAYAVYLPYSLINYMIVMPILAIFPVAGMLRDFPRLARQQKTFADQLGSGLSESEIMVRFQRLELRFQSVCGRYIDVLALLGISIHFEYWLGRFTLTDDAFKFMIWGWLFVAFSVGCFLWVVHLYGMSIEGVKKSLVASHSLNLATFMNQHNPASFLRWLITGRVGGLVIISLALPLLLWLIRTLT